MMLPLNDWYCLLNHVFASPVKYHLKELGIIDKLITHHELELKLFPDLMRKSILFTKSKLDFICQILVKFGGAAPELSEMVYLDITRLLASSLVNFEHLFLFVVIDEVVISQLLYHEPSWTCSWQMNVQISWLGHNIQTIINSCFLYYRHLIPVVPCMNSWIIFKKIMSHLLELLFSFFFLLIKRNLVREFFDNW